MSVTDKELSPFPPRAVVVHVVRMGEDKEMSRGACMSCRGGAVTPAWLRSSVARRGESRSDDACYRAVELVWVYQGRKDTYLHATGMAASCCCVGERDADRHSEHESRRRRRRHPCDARIDRTPAKVSSKSTDVCCIPRVPRTERKSVHFFLERFHPFARQSVPTRSFPLAVFILLESRFDLTQSGLQVTKPGLLGDEERFPYLVARAGGREGFERVLSVLVRDEASDGVEEVQAG